jgi:hypothetical protein
MHLSALLSGPSAYPGGITIHMLLDPDHSFDLDAAFQRWSGKKEGVVQKCVTAAEALRIVEYSRRFVRSFLQIPPLLKFECLGYSKWRALLPSLLTSRPSDFSRWGLLPPNDLAPRLLKHPWRCPC